MLFECVTITSVSDNTLSLKSVRGSACERCARGEGCGGGIIGKLAFRRDAELQLQASDTGRFAVGQTVELSVDAGRVMATAACVYLIPLFGLLAGALLGQMFFDHDLGSVLLAVVFLILSMVFIRMRLGSVLTFWLAPTIRSRGDLG